MNEVKDKAWFLREGPVRQIRRRAGRPRRVRAGRQRRDGNLDHLSRHQERRWPTACREKAEATAKRIEQSMSDLERQIRCGTRASATAANLDRTMQQRRADYAQLLNQLPAVSQLSFLSGTGRELLRMSRTQVVTFDGDADFARDIRFIETNAKGVTFFAPVYFVRLPPVHVDRGVAFRRQRRRHAGRDRPASFSTDFLGEAQIGRSAYAYVVDARGQVLAVGSKGPGGGLRNSPMLPQVAALLKAGRRAADLRHRF